MSEEDQDEHLGEMTLKPMRPRRPMGSAFIQHCQEYHLDPHMPCFRAMVSGDLMLKLIIRAHAFSKSAREKINALGGSAELIENSQS